MKYLTKFCLFIGLIFATHAWANDPADLNDLEIAHVAYTANTIDIRYAHLALALSETPEVRAFAETMISDHTAVTAAALELLDKLGAEPQDNFLSRSLNVNADSIIDDLAVKRGADFDRAYAANELAYHQAVNDLIETAFLPNIENAEVKALFEQGLEIFKVHEGHAEKMVEAVK